MSGSQVGVAPAVLSTRPLLYTHRKYVPPSLPPFPKHIGTTVRTSVKGTLPPPILPPCDNIVCTVVPVQGSVYTRTLMNTAASIPRRH